MSIPVAAAILGLTLFFLGIGVASVDVSALGTILFLWGVTSFSALYIGRRRRAARASKEAH
jgi:hypothetical protein